MKNYLNMKTHNENVHRNVKKILHFCPSTMVDPFDISAKMAVLSADHLRITSLSIFVYINEWISYFQK